MNFILTVLGAWLLADFISGVVHWWEDRAIVGTSRFEFINSVRADNEIHHLKPGHLLTHSYWGNINTTAPASWAIALGLVLIGSPLIFILTSLFMGFGNLIHRFAHTPPGKIPRIIRALQELGLFSSPSHHSGHHFRGRGELVSRNTAEIRYCVMSDWLNPWLDKIKFFNFLNKLLEVR